MTDLPEAGQQSQYLKKNVMLLVDQHDKICKSTTYDRTEKKM